MSKSDVYLRFAARSRRVAMAVFVGLGVLSLISSWNATGLRVRTVHMNILTAFVVGISCVAAFVVIDIVTQLVFYATMVSKHQSQYSEGALGKAIVEDLGLLGATAVVAIAVLWFH